MPDPTPTFNTTAVNWADIGDQLFTGAMKAAALGDLRKSFVSTAAEKDASVIGAFFDLTEDVAFKVGELLHTIEEPFLPIIAAFVAPILGGLFGAEVDESDVSRGGWGEGGGNRGAQAIVDHFVQAIVGDTPAELNPQTGRASHRRRRCRRRRSRANVQRDRPGDPVAPDPGHRAALSEVHASCLRRSSARSA
jgi:hypothetical protein